MLTMAIILGAALAAVELGLLAWAKKQFGPGVVKAMTSPLGLILSLALSYFLAMLFGAAGVTALAASVGATLTTALVYRGWNAVNTFSSRRTTVPVGA